MVPRNSKASQPNLSKVSPRCSLDTRRRLLAHAEEAQVRGRKILEQLNDFNGRYVLLLKELKGLEATILRTRRNVEAVNENIRTANARRGPNRQQSLYHLPAEINALVRTHRNLPVTDVAVLPQIVADGPFWEGASPQFARFKG